MKRKIHFLTILLIVSFSILAQSTEKAGKVPSQMFSHFLEYTKKSMAKPSCQFRYDSIDNEKEFRKMKLSGSEMQSVLDTLVANSTLGLDKNKFVVSLSLQTHFPQGFLCKELAGITKLEIQKSDVYDHLGRKLKLSGSGSLNFQEKSPTSSHGNNIAKPISIIFHSGLKDTTDFDTLSYGTIDYRISFVSDYVKIPMTRADISKSFKINDDSVRLVDVYDNKVILEQIDHHTMCSNKQLLNLDSAGRKAVVFHASSYTESGKKNYDYAGEGSLLLPKEIYLLVKNKPDLTMEEFVAFEKEGKYLYSSKYIVLSSPAPINSNFIIYFPIYGFSRVFTVKLDATKIHR